MYVWRGSTVAWSACKYWVPHPDRRPMRSLRHTSPIRHLSALLFAFFSLFGFMRGSGRSAESYVEIYPPDTAQCRVILHPTST
ncbi:hypothetical protein K449DRAFT_389208 [Hypoxylon sp. EC38]|nr:hypothetical protein K449DRAFT_389208 [Hypoxylon sp. EC38]